MQASHHPIGALLCIDDPVFQAHVAASPHPEQPLRQRIVSEALQKMAEVVRLEQLAPVLAREADVLRVHHSDYLQQLRQASEAAQGEQEIRIDADTYLGRESLHTAYLAAGSAVALAEALIARSNASTTDRVDTSVCGFLNIRPPGHHATPTRAMGFCLLNNAAIAASTVAASLGERVAIVDWDVHHGNGTQDAFYSDPSILYLSTHQAALFPGTGLAEQHGSGPGLGTTVNLPLAEGADASVYQAVFQQIVVPILREFDPKFIIVSAGFDAEQSDPLGGMHLPSKTFGTLAAMLRRVTDDHCPGRLLFCLEGGYSQDALAGGVTNSVHGALNPANFPLSEGTSSLSAERIAELTALRRAHAPHWRSLR
jgi:acetoin utilization deacetylase AcuC-like enzyme